MICICCINELCKHNCELLNRLFLNCCCLCAFIRFYWHLFCLYSCCSEYYQPTNLTEYMQSLVWNAFPVSYYIFTTILWALSLLEKGIPIIVFQDVLSFMWLFECKRLLGWQYHSVHCNQNQKWAFMKIEFRFITPYWEWLIEKSNLICYFFFFGW